MEMKEENLVQTHKCHGHINNNSISQTLSMEMVENIFGRDLYILRQYKHQ